MGDASNQTGQLPGSSTPNVIACGGQSATTHAKQRPTRPAVHTGGQISHSGPFYSQYDSITPSSRDPSHSLGPPHTMTGFPTSAYRLDMSALAHDLPESSLQMSSSRSFMPYQQVSPAQGYEPAQYGLPSAHNLHHYSNVPTAQHSNSGMRLSSTQALHTMPQHNPHFSNAPYGGYMPSAQRDMRPAYGQGSNAVQNFHPGSAPQYAMGMDPRAFVTGVHSLNVHAPGQSQHTFARRPSDTGPTPSYPRGPPRKPKQSGNALWVGNLPPGTSIIDLKDHFSRGATKDIESLFLISKSNCAFVNYKSEGSCQTAMSRFHDSRFHGVRLVCRLRRGTAPTSTNSPSRSHANTDRAAAILSEDSSKPVVDGVLESLDVLVNPATSPIIKAQQISNEKYEQFESAGPVSSGNTQKMPERYFVVKSLTMQDLEASVRDGIWATQSHNENALNKAFRAADSVYLIFSANKSGEYFGYARMLSPIDGKAVTANPRAEPQSFDPSDGPISFETRATEHAPQGRVIDDSARGTIFWEADSSEAEADEQEMDGSVVDGKEADSPRRSPDKEVTSAKEEGAKQDWGKPFQIEWLSTAKLPFYRTRGLRNPWNSNREVKIARDGTELEPSIGRCLVGMFHRPSGQAPSAYPPPMQIPPPVVGMGGPIQNWGPGQVSPEQMLYPGSSGYYARHPPYS